MMSETIGLKKFEKSFEMEIIAGFWILNIFVIIPQK
jgi:hypothetical protein